MSIPVTAWNVQNNRRNAVHDIAVTSYTAGYKMAPVWWDSAGGHVVRYKVESTNTFTKNRPVCHGYTLINKTGGNYITVVVF